MPNLISQNISLSLNKNFKNKNRIKTSKHFPSSNREWKNSIYLYNKNYLNLMPITDSSCINIVKSFFSLFNESVERKLRTKRLSVKFRRLSSNKIYISNGEFKHTNNKVIINLYLFNRQRDNYSLAINKIKNKLIFCLKHSQEIFSGRLIYFLFQSLMSLNKQKLFIIKKIKKERNNSEIIDKYINTYIMNYCKKFINNEKKKRLLYWYYQQINYINESKYTYVFLQYLKEHLYKLYNKQIEFNLINLRRFYLNSDILSESITKKITKNRRKTLHYLNKLKNKVKVERNISFLHKYIINNKLEDKNNLTKSTNQLIKTVINNLKYKDITGFRLEAKGRLTKRYTASRSLYKIKYKGNLLNIDSSLKGLSSVLLKGNLKSNVQYTKLTSKSRIGSFGIKGWISSN